MFSTPVAQKASLAINGYANSQLVNCKPNKQNNRSNDNLMKDDSLSSALLQKVINVDLPSHGSANKKVEED